MNNNSKTQIYINDNEITEFVVCEHAWKLKKDLDHNSFTHDERSKKGISEKKRWKGNLSSISFLKKQLQVLIVLLLGVVAVVMLSEYKKLINEFAGTKLSDKNIEVAGLVILILLIASLFVWNVLKTYILNEIDKEGINVNREVSDKTLSSSIEVREFKSRQHALRSKPDAVITIKEAKYPVLKLPLSKKVMDRHIAKIIAQLICIEEETGIAPEHGILIMGKKARRVEIKYTKERKEALLATLERMKKIIAKEGSTKASPSFYKCKNCDVVDKCIYKHTSTNNNP